MDISPRPASLDPSDWSEMRRQGHLMLDDMFDHMQVLKDGPVWRAPPAQKRAQFRADLPWAPHDLADVHARFMEDIALAVVIIWRLRWNARS
jgi:hypothetical protein